MTKGEFVTRINGTVSDADYRDIEFVYTWHPSISQTKGKEQIASLYDTFGMRVIRDMMPTAEKAKKLQMEILCKRNQLEALQTELRELSNCLED